MSEENEICYLCGEVIEGDCNRDHVPPQMFYGREVRKQNQFQLRTLNVHPSCNTDYKMDEEYFTYSMGPLASESRPGQAILEDIAHRFHVEGRNRPLAIKTLREFEARPSGLFLPGGKIVKRTDRGRIERVVWKILRGLYFRQTKRVLDRSTGFRFRLYGPDHPPPDLYSPVLGTESLGDYPLVFDYKRAVFQQDNLELEVWAMLFWDKIIGFVSFHGVECGCAECATLTARV